MMTIIIYIQSKGVEKGITEAFVCFILCPQGEKREKRRAGKKAKGEKGSDPLSTSKETKDINLNMVPLSHGKE